MSEVTTSSLAEAKAPSARRGRGTGVRTERALRDPDQRHSAEKYKIQIQLSERGKDRLFDLVEMTEAETAAQVVREALRVYDILVKELQENGAELYLEGGAKDERVRLKLF